MKKIQINIYVPSIDENYDLLVPINMQGDDFIKMVQETVHTLSGEFYEIKERALLIDSFSGKIINSNNIVKYSGLKNGSRVLLV